MKSILLNSDTRYQRVHPIASIMSSDCKALTKDDDEHNHIGFRHTWLKMGEATIDGLRQAFLDHESRVRFGDSKPEDTYTFPRLSSLAIDGGSFLADQTLHFSPNLNVIIGGSGTGKSTIVQYLRMLFDQASTIRGQDVQANFEKSLATVSEATRVTASVILDGQQLQITSEGRSSGEVVASGSELDGKDVSGVFPVRFFGQREIYNIAENRAATVALLDDLDQSRLNALGRQISQLSTQYREAAVSAQGARRLQSQLRDVDADLAAKQVKVRRIEDEAAPFQALANAKDARDAAAELLSGHSVAVRALLEISDASVTIQEGDENEDERVVRLRAAATEACDALNLSVRTAVAEFNRTISGLMSGELTKSLEADAERLRSETEAVTAAFTERGIDLQQYEGYRADVARLTTEAAEIRERIHFSEEAESTRARLLSEIEELWNAEVDIRKESAIALNAAVPRTKTNKPFVEATVGAFGNDRAFKEQIDQYRGDRRKISDDDWSALIESVVARSAYRSPAQLLVSWVRELREGTTPDGLEVKDSRHQQRIVDCFPDEVLHELEISRIPDRVTVLLRREDGSLAGDLEGGLSVGQKCTAVLALLLALDVTPVIIDQPEDDIDNEFTYSEVVPLLRKVKERRQLIIVTHDPNIPVNADAEMIHALAAVGGRGTIKISKGKEAVGSLDQEHVRLAVEEIMEGSEVAFRRRFVKYGF